MSNSLDPDQAAKYMCNQKTVKWWKYNDRDKLLAPLVSSSERFGPRSGPTKCRACSGSKLFDTLIVFLKEFLKKLQSMQRVQCYMYMENTSYQYHYNVPE